MAAFVRDLVRHKAFADAGILQAMRESEPASGDAELLRLMAHALLANRFWLLLILGRGFDAAKESQPPRDLEELTERFRETHRDEAAWIASITPQELERSVSTEHLPGKKFSVMEAIVQVCMHSQGHRAQCATRLRALGVTPPTLDFILWVRDRE